MPVEFRSLLYRLPAPTAGVVRSEGLLTLVGNYLFSRREVKTMPEELQTEDGHLIVPPEFQKDWDTYVSGKEDEEDEDVDEDEDEDE